MSENLSENIFTSKLEKIATRDGYGDGVVEAGEKDENVVVLSADVTESTRSNKFEEKFPQRFIQTGVAEQNMAGIAAGLALSGKIPFIASYAVFSPGRNWDQIRVSICFSNLNVKIVGGHVGFSDGGDGATHEALEDVALMRVLPNMTVLCPADYEETKKAVVAAAEHVGPVYIRTSKAQLPVFTTKKTPFKIGEARIFMEGRDVTIISCGPILYEVMKAARELKLKHNISCEVINASTIKPLDKKTILKSAEKTGRVVTVEEHQVFGGLGSAVAEILAQESSPQKPIRMKIIGVEDTFGESGKFDELWEKYGISEANIILEVKNFFTKTNDF